MTQTISLSNQPSEILCWMTQFLSEEETVLFSRVSQATHRILENKDIQTRITNYKDTLFNALLDRAQILRGPNGFDGLINEAHKNSANYEYALSRYKNLLAIFLSIPETITSAEQFNEFIDFILYENGSIISRINENPNLLVSKDTAVGHFKELENIQRTLHVLRTEEQFVPHKLEKLTDRLNILRGPTGFDGLIDQAFKEMRNGVNAQSQEKFEALIEELNTIAHFDDNGKIIGGEIHKARERLEELKKMIPGIGCYYENMKDSFDGAVEAFSLKLNVSKSIASSIIHIYTSQENKNILTSIHEFKSTLKQLEESRKELISLNNELNMIAQYDEKGNLIGGILFKLTPVKDS